MGRLPSQSGKVAVAGASGLIGSTLVVALQDDGREVWRLVRRPAAGDNEIAWDPAAGYFEGASLEGFDAVVNLAGRGVADGRWTAKVKSEIRASRVGGTRLIAEALARLARPPRVWVNASAIGWYGDRGDDVLDETSPAGVGFLAETCTEWEAAVGAASDAGIAVVRARFGVVLSPEGGALKKMLPAFRVGAGARLGNGRQYMSVIGLQDAVRALRFALLAPGLSGPVNVVAPAPVTNEEFTRTLGRVLGRPAVLAIPEFAVRLLFGEMGRETLLASARVLPRALTSAGFEFRHADLDTALRFELGRTLR